MKTLSAHIDFPSDDPLTRMAVSALETEAKLGGLSVSIVPDASRLMPDNEPVLWATDRQEQHAGNVHILNHPNLL